MSHAADVLDSVVARLVRAGCIAAENEADDFLKLAPDESTLEGWLSRRERGEPPAWITGTTNFCGHRLRVAPGVYVPRAQSEDLARRAGALLPSYGRAIDLCTGAGAVAAVLIRTVPTASVIGADVDPRAAACARSNGVPIVVADLADAVTEAARFDLVTAVAPYVPTEDLRLLPPDVQRYEPRLALDGGADGLDLLRRIIVVSRRLLSPGGWLVLEVGGCQDDALAATLDANDFEHPSSLRDEEGDLRAIAARSNPQ